MSAMSKYLDALATCPAPGQGQTHGWKMTVANLGALAGVDAATAEREILDALGPRAAEKRTGVRAAIEKAYRERRGMECGTLPKVPTRPKPKRADKTAGEFIRRGGGRTAADLRALSPVTIDWGADERWKGACALLRAMFMPGELVACGIIHKDRRGAQMTVRTCAEWCQRFRDGEWIPPTVVINPLKPEGGKTKSGKPSKVCDDAVAVHRHAVVEFDKRPLAEQVNFWLGWGLDAVTAITFSGNKSLHVIVRVDAADAAEWDRDVRGELYRRRMVPFGADGATANPSRGARLAGAFRADTKKLQTLLFCREALA